MEGLEGPLHSCLQICSNSHFFVSIKNLSHTLETIVVKSYIYIYITTVQLNINDKGSRMLRINVMNILRT